MLQVHGKQATATTRRQPQARCAAKPQRASLAFDHRGRASSCLGLGLGCVASWHRAGLQRRAKGRGSRAAAVLPAEEYLSDQRLSLYRVNGVTDADRAQLVSELQQQALAAQGLSLDTPCKCDVHYSWACLERLLQAKDLGRQVSVGSVLLPPTAAEKEVALSIRCSESVFQAAGNLIDAGLALKGSRKNFCRFVVAYPVSRRLDMLSPPFLVIDKVHSSHSLGQILRTAYHFGIDSVVLSEAAWHYMDARAFRVSMGWAYHMDFHCAASLSDVCSELEGRGVTIYALSESPTAPDVQARPANAKNWALLLGCQDQEASLLPSISWVGIPRHLEGTMDLAHSSAICMYELAGLSFSEEVASRSGVAS